MITKNNFQGFQSFNWFFAIVEDAISDPLKLGRIRIRPFGIYSDDIPIVDLPWAICVQPVTSSAQQGRGEAPFGIENKSVVFGFFVDSDQQQPVVLGSFAGLGDINDLALGKNTITKKPVGPEPKDSFAANYPFNKVRETLSGHIFEVDDTKGAERIHTFHKSGSYQEYQSMGNVLNRSANDSFFISGNDLFVHSEGDTIETSINRKITDSSSFTLNSPSTLLNCNTSLKLQGGTVVIGGTTVSISPSGTVDITAPSINLNGAVSVSGSSFTWNGATVRAGPITG